jgi:hypothetical protein
MPEKDSSPESEELALELASKFGVSTVKENIQKHWPDSDAMKDVMRQ